LLQVDTFTAKRYSLHWINWVRPRHTHKETCKRHGNISPKLRCLLVGTPGPGVGGSGGLTGAGTAAGSSGFSSTGNTDWGGVKAPGPTEGGLDPTDPGTLGKITTLFTSCCCCCCWCCWWYCCCSSGVIFESQLSMVLPPPGATGEGAWPGKLLPGDCLGWRFELDPGFSRLPKPDSI
jgi:hypothetical protein